MCIPLLKSMDWIREPAEASTKVTAHTELKHDREKRKLRVPVHPRTEQDSPIQPRADG